MDHQHHRHLDFTACWCYYFCHPRKSCSWDGWEDRRCGEKWDWSGLYLVPWSPCQVYLCSTGITREGVCPESFLQMFALHKKIITGISFSQLFSVLFFIMLLTLCVGTIQGLLGSVITVIMDECAARWTLLVTIIVCVATFFASLFYTTPVSIITSYSVTPHQLFICL